MKKLNPSKVVEAHWAGSNRQSAFYAPLLILCNYFTIHFTDWHSMPIEQSIELSLSRGSEFNGTLFFIFTILFKKIKMNLSIVLRR